MSHVYWFASNAEQVGPTWVPKKERKLHALPKGILTQLADIRKYEYPTDGFNRSIKNFYSAVGTDMAEELSRSYISGDHNKLLMIADAINPSNYSNVDSFRADFTAASFLRKADFLKTGIDTKAVALDSFRAAEEQCGMTNRRFDDLSLDPLFKETNVYLLSACKRKIEKILANDRDQDGVCSTLNPEFVEEVLTSGGFGPGASTSITGSDTSQYRKFYKERQVSAQLYHLASAVLPKAFPLWYRDGAIKKGLRLRGYSKVITVPKNAKTDRTIAVEPGVNLYFQKAFGGMIRSRLRKCGLELNSSEKNEQLARRGSVTNDVATVDFSAASDTIAFSIVRELLPTLWFQLMDMARVPCYELDNTVRTFEKFSSMGNGFTFELETLIFYAAALVVTELCGLDTNLVSTYGDDVTIPSLAYPMYVEFTSFLGFTVNKRKSYESGPFRESCGSYWFNGVDVKPFFLKEKSVKITEVFNLHNAFMAIAHRWTNNDHLDAKFHSLISEIRNSIPLKFRYYGSVSGGDGCLHANFDEAQPLYNDRGWCGYSHIALRAESVGYDTDGYALICARLASTIASGESIQTIKRWSNEKGQNFDRLPTPQAAKLWGEQPEGLAYKNRIDFRNVTKLVFYINFTQQWYNFGNWA